MKMLISMVLVLGIMMFAGRFLMPGGGGLQDFLGGAGGDAETGLGGLGNATVKEDVTVYQWTDDQGVTHFGAHPPTGQGSYEKKEILADSNVMQALKPAEEEEEKEKPSRVTRIGSVYSPEGVKDLMTDANDLKDQMNDRMAEQEKMLNDIMKTKK